MEGWGSLSTLLETSPGTALCPVDCETRHLTELGAGLGARDSMLYISDRTSMSSLSELCLQGREDTITVTLEDREEHESPECTRWCSSYYLEEDCVGGCHNLTGQSCLWRQSLTSKGHNYSSCSPPIGSCLNGVCDSFEKLDPSLCPQDCYSREKGRHHFIFRQISVISKSYNMFPNPLI